MIILPVDRAESRTGTLRGVTAEEIEARLGFASNIADDPDKVSHSWGFSVDGAFAAIWSYKGSEKAKTFSTFDPSGVIPRLFPSATVETSR